MNFFELPDEVVVAVRDGRSATSSFRIVSIFVQAAFWASTPTALWNSVKAASNSGDEYCEEFQTPFVLKAEFR